jgi:hypothetical protein
MARAGLEVEIFGGEFAARGSLKTSQVGVINVAAAVMACWQNTRTRWMWEPEL